MLIVECGMCQDLCNIPEWKDSDIFICLICANILSEMKKTEIKFNKIGIKPLNSFTMALFDLKREKIRNKKVVSDY